MPALLHAVSVFPFPHAASEQEKTAGKRIFILRRNLSAAIFQRNSKPLCVARLRIKGQRNAGHGLHARPNQINSLFRKHGSSLHIYDIVDPYD